MVGSAAYFEIINGATPSDPLSMEISPTSALA
jgi:hypothetical protein